MRSFEHPLKQLITINIAKIIDIIFFILEHRLLISYHNKGDDFMEYRIGNSKKIKENGITAQLTCPKCNEKVSFSIFSNGKLDITAQLPIISNSKVYFAVCPNCAAVFEIENRAARDFDKGNLLSIGDFDLKELTKFND